MISLFDLPHGDARRLLATGAPVWLLVNPVEYHGPHLSMHTDRLISHGLSRELHVRLALRHGWQPVLGARMLELGVLPAGGIGSRYTAYPAARRAVVEAVRALVELGAERLVLMTFHGNPLHGLAVQAGVDFARVRGACRRLPQLNLLLADQLTLDPAGFADAVAGLPGDVAGRLLSALRFDFHAGFFETSLAMHFAPSSVSAVHRSLPSCPPIVPDRALTFAARVARALGRETLASELELAAVGAAWGAMRPYYGYTSSPAYASASAGEVFAARILARYEPIVDGVLTAGQAPPRPVLRWLSTLTLGGRLLPEHRPRPADVFTP